MSVTRVDYRERQRLTAADLRAEQEYRLAAAGRHHLGPHDWGVVTGLQVSGDPRRGLTVEPGLAFDGYGREILVLEPVSLPVDDTTKCWSVLLYFCERPEQVPPGRACQDEPAPRTRHDAVILLVERDREGPLPPSSLGLARAGGQAPGLPPWPVRLARVGTACADSSDDTPFVDMGRTRYVRHRAALLYGPSAATVQLGLRDREDLYAFLISTPPSARAAAERRLGIDRDHDVHVWKPLWLSGSKAGNQLAFAAGQAASFITAMPAGIGRRLRVDGTISARGRVTRAVILDQRPMPTAPLTLTRTVIDRSKPEAPLLLFGPRPIQLELLPLTRLPIDEGPAPLPVRARRTARAAVPLASAFSIELPPFGGQLSLKRPAAFAAPVATPACGDLDRFWRDQEREAPVVQWRPGSDLAADPNARELHAATVSPADAVVPRTALRISGGGEDTSDASSRVAIGAIDGGAWMPALQMNGGRGLQILGKKGEPALRVDGALYLPPIGRDDPLFPELMALAFMGGLFQSGATVTTLTVTLESVAPNPLKRGATFGYDLKIDYTGTKPRLQRCIEVISGFTAGRADVVFRPVQVTLPPTDGTVPIPVSTFRHRADSVEIRVLLLLKQGTTATGVLLAQSGAIPVID